MHRIASVVGLITVLAAPTVAAATEASSGITVHTEDFPRPPYSGATYYIYESKGQTVCTKLADRDKYDRCSSQYVPGAFRAPEDVGAGQPYSTTAAAAVAVSSLSKHVCLTRFGLAGRR